MVGVGGGEVVLRITGVQKTKRRRRKSCLWTGLIHRGEESTKSGYKDEKCTKKPCLWTGPKAEPCADEQNLFGTTAKTHHFGGGNFCGAVTIFFYFICVTKNLLNSFTPTGADMRPTF